jgi:hypothetical protein
MMDARRFLVRAHPVQQIRQIQFNVMALGGLDRASFNGDFWR